jgi:hypothetical protein
VDGLLLYSVGTESPVEYVEYKENKNCATMCGYSVSLTPKIGLLLVLTLRIRRTLVIPGEIANLSLLHNAR